MPRSETRYRANRTRRRGLTLPELIIGSAMLAMIGTALTSFTLAMSAGWANSDRQFKVENASKRTGDQLESALSGMLYVAQNKTPTTQSPSSYVFYWAKDGVNVAADQKAQLGEMALLEFDPATKSIRLFAPRTSGLNGTQTATLNADAWGDPTLPAIVTYFKSLDSVEMTPIVGGAASGVDVESATFTHFTPVGSKPMTSYLLNLANGTASDSNSGTVPMRGGRKPTNF